MCCTEDKISKNWLCGVSFNFSKKKLAVFYVLQVALIHVCTEECGIREADVVVIVAIGIVKLSGLPSSWPFESGQHFACL